MGLLLCLESVVVELGGDFFILTERLKLRKQLAEGQYICAVLGHHHKPAKVRVTDSTGI